MNLGRTELKSSPRHLLTMKAAAQPIRVVPYGPASINLDTKKLVCFKSTSIVTPASDHKQINAPARRKLARGLSSSRSWSNSRKRILPTFFEAFGLVIVPAIILDLICICWTVWLIVLTLEPNATANYLMDTEEFDDGRFWMLIDQSTEMKTFVVACFVVVIVGYVLALNKLLFHRHGGSQPWLQRIERQVDKLAPRFQMLSIALQYWREVTGFRGRYRKFWNLCLKISDLIMQALTLVQLLNNGADSSIVIGYSAFLVAHSTIFAAIFYSQRHTALEEIIIDSAFDLISTIALPMVVLLHAYATCDIDYESFHIYNDVLPEGSFERRARMSTNPYTIAKFRQSFDALRIRSASDIFIKLGMNLFFSYRFNRMIEELVYQRFSGRSSTIKAIAKQHHVPKVVSPLFVAAASFVVVYITLSISNSRHACAGYPQCVTYAYWVDSNGSCPCLTLIDASPAARTYDEWLDPPNVTDTVRELAALGTLTTLQLTNRNLPELPEELRACTGLELLSLVYTGTHTIPSWLTSFTRLQYIHIDGRYGGPTLLELPDDMFSNFPSLMFLQIGVHMQLKRLPEFNGLPNLRSLFLARLFTITEVPSFLHMHQLERVELTYLPVLRTLPELSPIASSLVHFALYRPSFVCCNGFLDTACNLTHPFCSGIPSASIPVAKCIHCEAQEAPNTTLGIIKQFNYSVCQPSNIDFASDFPNRERADICGGVLYRQCKVDNKTGICYNSRLQVIGCTIDPNKIKIRQLQIERGAGLPCNIEEEAWLGCGNYSK